jgi:hypothetical protein
MSDFRDMEKRKVKVGNLEVWVTRIFGGFAVFVMKPEIYQTPVGISKSWTTLETHIVKNDRGDIAEEDADYIFKGVIDKIKKSQM